MHVNVLDFMSHLVESWEPRGRVQSNHCERTGRRVRLSGTSLCLKRLVSSQIIAGRTLNAVSDGAFAATHHDLRVLFGFLLFSNTPMPLAFLPMSLRRRSLPFDDPDCFFELKYDGFRALAVIE